MPRIRADDVELEPAKNLLVQLELEDMSNTSGYIGYYFKEEQITVRVFVHKDRFKGETIPKKISVVLMDIE